MVTGRTYALSVIAVRYSTYTLVDWFDGVSRDHSDVFTECVISARSGRWQKVVKRGLCERNNIIISTRVPHRAVGREATKTAR